uniref:Uncharacterized protein n=1 Tax=Rhizopus stolonifer TaxID=4846 RepID=A0A2Z3E6L8_RHIST|nr:hypothetical protein [Rhizopus stolonifer]
MGKIGGNENLHESKFFRWMVDNHFMHVYKQEGRNQLVEALNQWFSKWEKDQEEINEVGYSVDDKNDVDRMDYIMHWTKKIAVQAFLEDPLLIDASIDNLINTQVMTPTKVWLDSEIMIEPEIYDMMEEIRNGETWESIRLENDIWTEQESMADLYSGYQALIKEEEQIRQKKNEMLNRFVKKTNKWSHMRFAKPSNKQRSVQNYLTTKYKLLKEIVPDHKISRIILNKMKKEDTWVNKSAAEEEEEGEENTFEDELSQSEGICDTEEQYWSDNLAVDSCNESQNSDTIENIVLKDRIQKSNQNIVYNQFELNYPTL